MDVEVFGKRAGNMPLKHQHQSAAGNRQGEQDRNNPAGGERAIGTPRRLTFICRSSNVISPTAMTEEA